MKKILIVLIFYWPLSAWGQSYINPDTIYQSGDIILQNTDVYYCPFAPPTPADVRGYLSVQSDVIRDPNGVGDFWRNYLPVNWNADSSKWDTLSNMAPCGGAPLGRYVVWQRFFTARDKPNHSHSDIIVGSNIVTPDTIFIIGWPAIITHASGPVTVSKNEDVDFRASGTVKMENGFHVMPGAFFHAYQEPRWGPTVFSDDFDTTALDQSKWHVITGQGETSECSNDSNVIMDTDYEATDGHVADVILREIPDTCSCLALLPDYWRKDTTCSDELDTRDILLHYLFSSATLVACPFPFNQPDTPHTLIYQHIPYGKYEVREKLPHLIYHTNNWGYGGSGEWDMNESWSAGEVHQGLGRYYLFGPQKGVFRKSGDTIFFISSAANWSAQFNTPIGIVIDNIFYEVGLAPNHNKDTVTGRTSTFVQGGFPSSYVNSGDSVTFYYQHWPFISADNVPWNVTQDGSGHWSIFSAPYHVIGPGDSLRFNKAYQPVTITIHVRTHPDSIVTFNCRWDSALNAGTDTGLLVLMDGGGNPDSISDTLLHTNTAAYPFSLSDYGTRGPTGEIGQTQIDTLGLDSASQAHWATTPYKYHTFGMEWLPNEIRFLVDSNVVRRIPDRMVPPGNQYFDWASRTPRGPEDLQVAEFFLNGGTYPIGLDSAQRAFFEKYDTTCSGCQDVTIGGHTYHAAHQKVDYVKVWDVPADMKITNYTR